MIEKVMIGTKAAGSDELTSPPGRLVEVQVVAGVAYLGYREAGPFGDPAGDLTDELVVPARSLLRALTLLLEEEEAPLPLHFIESATSAQAE